MQVGYLLGHYLSARCFCEQRGPERLEVSSELGGGGAPSASAVDISAVLG